MRPDLDHLAAEVDRNHATAEARTAWVTARVDRYFAEHSSGFATDDQINRWTAKAVREWTRRHPAMAAHPDGGTA